MEWYINEPSICKKNWGNPFGLPHSILNKIIKFNFIFLFIYYESKKGCLIFLFIILLTEYINIGKFPLNKK